MNVHKMLMRESTLKVGDRVRITHKVPDNHLGWNAVWDPEMDKYVGKEGVIERIFDEEDNYGFRVNTGSTTWSYPVFCLEFVGKSVIEVKISDSYTARVYPGEKIVVGCQTVTKEVFEELKKAFEK